MDATTTSVSASELGRYLDAIVELTRHRDPQELAAALLRTVRANVPAQQVRLLALSNDNRVTEFNESNLQNAMVFDPIGSDGEKPRPLSEDGDLLSCVRTQDPVSSAERDVDKIVMCADKALYYAKNHGRNQVCCYEKLIAEGKLEPVIMAEGKIELF